MPGVIGAGIVQAPRGAAGGGVAEWVTEYDWQPAVDESGPIDLMALAGSTFTDVHGAEWDVGADLASFTTAEINNTNGVELEDGGGADLNGSLGIPIGELVAIGGGPAYDGDKDSLWVEIDVDGLLMVGINSGFQISHFGGETIGQYASHDSGGSAVFLQGIGASVTTVPRAIDNGRLSAAYVGKWVTHSRWQPLSDPDRATPDLITNDFAPGGTNDSMSPLIIDTTGTPGPTTYFSTNLRVRTTGGTYRSYMKRVRVRRWRIPT